MGVARAVLTGLLMTLCFSSVCFGREMTKSERSSQSRMKNQVLLEKLGYNSAAPSEGAPSDGARFRTAELYGGDVVSPETYGFTLVRRQERDISYEKAALKGGVGASASGPSLGLQVIVRW